VVVVVVVYKELELYHINILQIWLVRSIVTLCRAQTNKEWGHYPSC
jgi:hypothetical protein